ncbi:hypothetical protein IKE99_00710 [Candidatus Saccharibacteria bacterium]|nr:hypothetical protein [Candidatus Saccharibacteria bacterium]
MVREIEPGFPDISNKQFQRLKRSLQSRERMNNNCLYLIPCSGGKGWYEMAENSALIFYYEIAKKKGLNYRFFDDSRSLYDKYEIGYVRLSNLNDLRIWLKESNLYDEEGKIDGMMVYFELKRTFTEKELENYRLVEMKRRTDLLAVEPAKNLAPEFYQLVLSFGSRLHYVCNAKLDKLASNTLGRAATMLIDEVLEAYYQITFLKSSQKARIEEKWVLIRKDLYLLLTKIKVISDFCLLDFRSCISYCSTVRRLIDLAEEQIKKLMKNK